MKVLRFLVFAISILMISCSEEDLADTAFTGKWKLVQTYYSIGGPLIYNDINPENEEFIQFKNNGRLVYPNSDYTEYKLKDSTTITFIKKDKTTQDYYFVLNEEILDLSPAGPIRCIEGCGSRYKKVQ